MGMMDLNSEFDVMAERASGQDGFQVVEWNVRSSAASTNPDSEIDNGCGCGCGCG